MLPGGEEPFPLVTNSVQTLKRLDIHTRMTNNISFVCCLSSFTICCVLLEVAAQQEGERPPSCSLLAVTYWINAQSFGVRGEMVRVGGLPRQYTSEYSQEQEGDTL